MKKILIAMIAALALSMSLQAGVSGGMVKVTGNVLSVGGCDINSMRIIDMGSDSSTSFTLYVIDTPATYTAGTTITAIASNRIFQALNTYGYFDIFPVSYGNKIWFGNAGNFPLASVSTGLCVEALGNTPTIFYQITK